ncbi:hypothetical protein BX616_007264 [Lobosporangium transversale]|uniref:tRNA:m(4)X modification enzyme TRM13 n=1 Tax=Lobosporangium transversale TaxID=64571 RepID=A0A1Y2GH06_9FUNG|nr:methyltransferase TRM13-domain-containing protein [Lobosporangium transversale]KAF9914941.1 hypothetical protein BX616_007264 [Lobosporangium transversale]ORZ09447.1 methyltransferase TRM13-domain-containing protein [Lobosporangium transversale]|eukprot:XP_021878900.1 methyltransferase TRM13-domain-containing protein [Lobosporangium transversale]
MQYHPVICQHAVWGSKQQRFRHCKLPAKLSPLLLEQIQQLEERCFVNGSEISSHGSGTVQITEKELQNQLEGYLDLRSKLLQPLYDAQQILCGHHQKEFLREQAAQELIQKEKAAGIYQDPETKRLSKDLPIDPKDIPSDFLRAIERVFSKAPSLIIQQVLDHWDGPDEWKLGRGGTKTSYCNSTIDDGDQDPVGEEKKLRVEEFPCHESFEALFADAGTKKKRHLAQESQLIQAMISHGLLDCVSSPLHEGSGDASDKNNHYGRTAGSNKDSHQTGSKRRPVFVEFGAGTGGLSRHLQLVLESIVSKRISGPLNTSTTPEPVGPVAATLQTKLNHTSLANSVYEPYNFVLLDRQKFRSRNQVDYMIRTQARPVKPRLLRITKDVRELKLKNLQLIHEVEPGVAWREWTEGGGEVDPQDQSTLIPTQYICISKHFCGSATDLALSWIREQRQQQQQQGEMQSRSKSLDSYSICFATCCHGICEPSLVARPYLKELLSVASIKKRKRVENDQRRDDNPVWHGKQQMQNQQEDEKYDISDDQLGVWIPWIIKLTGWATLGKQEESTLVARPGKDASGPGIWINKDDEATTFTRDQRRVLGKRCKKLLDMARCLYLIRECGFKNAVAIEYTEESVESGAIVGSM